MGRLSFLLTINSYGFEGKVNKWESGYMNWELETYALHVKIIYTCRGEEVVSWHKAQNIVKLKSEGKYALIKSYLLPNKDVHQKNDRCTKIL